MRRLAAVVGLVSLVLLAGCSGTGFDTGTETPATVTPAPVPTDDPLSDPPDGLSEDGITDSFALADAHADALANTSFTVRRNHTLVASNGTRLVDTSSVQRIRADHSRWMVERSYNGTYAQFARRPVTDVDSWFNGSHGLYRLQGQNGTEYFVFPITGASGPVGRQQLISYYTLTESTAVSTANGRIRLEMNVRPETNRPISPLRVNVTERTVALTLTETGRVERYRVEYTGRLRSDPNTTVEGVRVVRFRGLDETTVERPDWIATARNATAARGETVDT
ncbi:DUF7537 family lipoprotein [Halococcus agarilyticus]|uniref:DUF7537 family lipoprotein n=1 Tax=Halococcus agarilyticus TaxID=1232219 RepID=UPI0006775F10|nr:hypothetical protein [Halococcus agarilyticus]